MPAFAVCLVTFNDFMRKYFEGLRCSRSQFDDVYFGFQVELLRYFLFQDVLLLPRVSLVYSVRLQCFLSQALPFTMAQICCSLCYFQEILDCFAFRPTIVVKGDKTCLATFASFFFPQDPLHFLI